MFGYVIESWNQPFGEGYGWAPCHGNCKDARWYVFSKRLIIRNDPLDGNDYASKREAEEAIKKHVAGTVIY